MMRHRKPDYTGQQVEYVDNDFELSIGELPLGPFKLSLVCVGRGEDFEEAEFCTIENANYGPPVTLPVRFRYVSGGRPLKDMRDALINAVSDEIERQWEATIGPWCVDEAARQGLGEPDPDIMRDDRDERRRLEAAE